MKLPAGEESDPGKTLLVVDDEQSVTAALTRLFYLEGYRVLAAGSAAEGFELLATNRVSVLISDQRMPGMNGTEFLGRVKELYPDTVRIIMSGHSDLETVTNAVNNGAVYKIVNKPWNDEMLLGAIAEAFKYQKVHSLQLS